MTVYPHARYRPVSGESNDPPIHPVGVILHSSGSMSARSLYDWFNGPSGGIESHLHIARDGYVEQYRNLDREADANWHGNRFLRNGVYCGFLSVETQNDGYHSWTDAQIDAILAFIRWVSHRYGFPLRRAKAWNRPGLGYHIMFGSPGPWTPASKICPGPKPIRQFNNVILPTLASGGDMPLSDDDLDKIEKRLISAVVPKVWGLDGMVDNPSDGSNPSYAAGTVLREVLKRLRAQGQEIGEIRGALEALTEDLARVPNAVWNSDRIPNPNPDRVDANPKVQADSALADLYRRVYDLTTSPPSPPAP